MNSAISRRIEAAIRGYIKNDFEDSLIHYFPALDKTSKKRRPNAKVGVRIKAFLREQGDIMTTVGLGFYVLDSKFEGVSFEDAIYKFGRNPIAHEGELDTRLRITEGMQIRIGKIWELPSSMILGLLIGLITAPENIGESVGVTGKFTIAGRQFEINELWGRELMIREFLSKSFGDNIKSPNYYP